MEFTGYFYILMLVIFGASVGSFVTVIASRYNSGLPISSKRSFCFSCSSVLKIIDLVPILSFFFIRGRCRYCHVKISSESFWVEVLIGILSLFLAYKVGFLVLVAGESIMFDFNYIAHYLLSVALIANVIVIALYDLRHFIIPDSFLLFMVSISFIYRLLLGFSLTQTFIGVFVALPFLLLFFISKGRWIGFGDIKYMAVIGILFRFSGAVSTIVVSFWIGALFSILFILVKNVIPGNVLPETLKGLTIKSEIPFGPFLSAGIVLSMFFSIDLFYINFI